MDLKTWNCMKNMPSFFFFLFCLTKIPLISCNQEIRVSSQKYTVDSPSQFVSFSRLRFQIPLPLCCVPLKGFFFSYSTFVFGVNCFAYCSFTIMPRFWKLRIPLIFCHFWCRNWWVWSLFQTIAPIAWLNWRRAFQYLRHRVDPIAQFQGEESGLLLWHLKFQWNMSVRVN